jgi:hypothetical protein
MFPFSSSSSFRPIYVLEDSFTDVQSWWIFGSDLSLLVACFFSLLLLIPDIPRVPFSLLYLKTKPDGPLLVTSGNRRYTSNPISWPTIIIDSLSSLRWAPTIPVLAATAASAPARLIAMAHTIHKAPFPPSIATVLEERWKTPTLLSLATG